MPILISANPDSPNTHSPSAAFHLLRAFTFWKKYTKITETVKSPPKNGGDFSGKKGEKRVGKTIEKFRRKCVENPPEKVKSQA